MEGRFNRIHCTDHGEWLSERLKRIQASEAASVLDVSPWTSSAELFDIKTGRAVAKDISSRPYIIYGHEAEGPVREMFLLDSPFFKSEYYPYDILVSKTAEFLGATLDGELEVISEKNPWGLRKGARGIYEGKTGSFRKEGDLAVWDGRESYLPLHYYTQILHQLLVTGWDFVILNARLRRQPYCESDNGFPEIRCFTRMIERSDLEVRNDMMTLYKAEKHFWTAVQEGKRPARRIAI